jgi:hypothetical protein
MTKRRFVATALALFVCVGLTACSTVERAFTTMRDESASADDAWTLIVGSAFDGMPPYQAGPRPGPPRPALEELVAAAGRTFQWTEDWLPSRDGRRIAFVGARETPDGWTETTCVADTSAVSWRELEEVGAPRDWSPDGTKLLCDVTAATANGPRRGYAVVDVATGEIVVRRFEVGGDMMRSYRVAFSPDGNEIAVTRDALIRVVELATGRVRDAWFPDSSHGVLLVDWLPDGRIAYVAHQELLLLARPGEDNAQSIPIADDEDPVRCRPDGRAAYCTCTRWGWMYERWGGVIRYDDGRAVDLWVSHGRAGLATWLPSPGLPASPVR